MKSFSLVLLGALLAAMSDAIQINQEKPFRSGMKLPIFKLPDIKKNGEKEETPILGVQNGQDTEIPIVDQTLVADTKKVGPGHHQDTEIPTDETTQAAVGNQEKVGPGHI